MGNADWYRQIHERLLAEDPVAPAELAEALLEPLVKKLQRRHPRLRESDLLREAASDALMSYMKHPSQFDPAKRGLMGYLVMAAEGDLRNTLAKAWRRRGHEISLEDVELRRAAGKEAVRRPGPDSQLVYQEMRGKVDELFKDPRDREAVDLIADGERSTEVFAELWGLQGLSPKEQRREVKRHKDRIKKMLERHRKDSHGRGR